MSTYVSDDGYSTDWSVESGLLRAIFNIAGEVEEDFQWIEQEDEDCLSVQCWSITTTEKYVEQRGESRDGFDYVSLLLDEEESRLSHVWNVLFQRNLQSETATDFGEP